MTQDLSHIRNSVTGIAGRRKCDWTVNSYLEAVLSNSPALSFPSYWMCVNPHYLMSLVFTVLLPYYIPHCWLHWFRPVPCHLLDFSWSHESFRKPCIVSLWMNRTLPYRANHQFRSQAPGEPHSFQAVKTRVKQSEVTIAPTKPRTQICKDLKVKLKLRLQSTQAISWRIKQAFSFPADQASWLILLTTSLALRKHQCI